jgi:hypothetical protein
MRQPNPSRRDGGNGAAVSRVSIVLSGRVFFVRIHQTLACLANFQRSLRDQIPHAVGRKMGRIREWKECFKAGGADSQKKLV